MQLYLPVTVSARPSARRSSPRRWPRSWPRRRRGCVTAVMAKARRRGKVFVDWSQNNPHKTTIASYSLRGRARPTVATPVTWDEVRAACRAPERPGVHRRRPARRGSPSTATCSPRCSATRSDCRAAAEWQDCPPCTRHPISTGRVPGRLRPPRLAHRRPRGCENTLAAFRRAVAEGFGYLELDVHASADGVAVVHHDALLDRTTDGTGPLAAQHRRRAGEGAGARPGADPAAGAGAEELPDTRITIELKSAAVVAPMLAAAGRGRRPGTGCASAASSRRGSTRARRGGGRRLCTSMAKRRRSACAAGRGWRAARPAAAAARLRR